LRWFVAVALLALPWTGCGGSTQAANAAPAAAPTAPDAASFSQNGFTLARIDGWTFITPDGTMARDTAIILQGPEGKEALAPAVEVSRRQLTARDRRRKPSHILTQMTTEIVQTFDGFEMVGTPEDIELAGKPAAIVRIKFTESLPDGVDVQRAGRFYGLVNGENIWVIRCLGAQDGSNDGDFDKIIASLRLEN
jgi:hypothetical protein